MIYFICLENVYKKTNKMGIFDDIGNAFKSVGTSFNTAVIQPVAGAVNEKKIVGALQGVGEKTLSGLENVGKTTLSGLTIAGNSTLSGLETAGNTTLSGLETAGNTTLSGLQTAGDAILTGLKTAGLFILQGIMGLFSPSQKGVQEEQPTDYSGLLVIGVIGVVGVGIWRLLR